MYTLNVIMSDFKSIYYSNKKNITNTLKYVIKYFFYQLFLKKSNKKFIWKYIYDIIMFFNTNFDWCKYSYFLPNIDNPIKKYIYNILDHNWVMLDVW
jgi:hypothetical protein